MSIIFVCGYCKTQEISNFVKEQSFKHSEQYGVYATLPASWVLGSFKFLLGIFCGDACRGHAGYTLMPKPIAEPVPCRYNTRCIRGIEHEGDCEAAPDVPHVPLLVRVRENTHPK